MFPLESFQCWGRLCGLLCGVQVVLPKMKKYYQENIRTPFTPHPLPPFSHPYSSHPLLTCISSSKNRVVLISTALRDHYRDVMECCEDAV